MPSMYWASLGITEPDALDVGARRPSLGELFDRVGGGRGLTVAVHIVNYRGESGESGAKMSSRSQQQKPNSLQGESRPRYTIAEPSKSGACAKLARATCLKVSGDGSKRCHERCDAKCNA